MIRPRLVLLAMTLTIASSVPAANYRYLTPYTFDRQVDVQIAGKSRTYYSLSGSDRVQIKVKGPTRLRIISRAVLDSRQDSVEYQFIGRREGARKSVAYRHTSRTFDNATLPGNAAGGLSAARSKVLDVPRGDQTYTFFLPRNSGQTVLLRFAREFADFAQGNKIVAMTPVFYSTKVELVTKEEAAAYYRVGSSDNVKLRFIGPATVKIMTRIEFDQSMNGRQKWRVQVVEDGKVKATHSVSATRSQLTAYRESSPYVPSQAQTLFIEVPEGTHDYEFRLPDNHRSALFRFLLSEKQLEGE